MVWTLFIESQSNKKIHTMKSVSIFFLSTLMALSVFAQNIASTVTIQVNGNRNRQVVVDGRSYSMSDYSNTSENNNNAVNNAITITDLQPGQHSLQVLRSSQNNYGRRNSNTTSFNLRSGYDLLITINGDGTIQLKESRKRGNRRVIKTPMTDARFATLLQNVQRQWNTGSKSTLIASSFANTSNYFTTQQAIQLIQTVRAESSRLQLAKASYRSIVDPVNFTQVYSLLPSQSAKNDLASYVSTYNINNPQYNGDGYNNRYKTAMSSSDFNILIQDVQKQWLPGAKMSLLTNTFANTNNYFSTSQAKQLIQQVSEEPGRLQLAKASYRTIVDPENFTQIYEVLNTQASRNELAAYVNNYNSTNNSTTGNNYPNRPPMSDAGFNSLMQDIQKQWLPGAKMSALMNAFGNTNNYFSTYQAKQLIQQVGEESNRLQLAKASYRTIVDPSNFTQIYEVLNTQASRNELAAYVNNYNPYNTTTDNTNTYQYRTPMTDANFNQLMQEVQRQWVPNGKLAIVGNAFGNTANYFTTYQARQLIQLINDENNRLQLAKASYRTIVDPNNFTQLYDLLNSQASRNELAAYVNSYNMNAGSAVGNTGNQYRTAMSDEDYNGLIQQVESQWLPGAKMSALTNIFANGTYYFSTAQAKQLINYVTDENNRLQLAKSAYRNIVDPANFTQIYDLFSSQASKDELTAYVNGVR
jgi:Domain of unknown function (DUF4476)